MFKALLILEDLPVLAPGLSSNGFGVKHPSVTHTSTKKHRVEEYGLRDCLVIIQLFCDQTSAGDRSALFVIFC